MPQRAKNRPWTEYYFLFSNKRTQFHSCLHIHSCSFLHLYFYIPMHASVRCGFDYCDGHLVVWLFIHHRLSSQFTATARFKHVGGEELKKLKSFPPPSFANKHRNRSESQAGLPDGIVSNQKSQFGYTFELLIDDIGVCIMWPFGLFYGLLVIFCGHLV
jgi:hypothetical protein